MHSALRAASFLFLLGGLAACSPDPVLGVETASIQVSPIEGRPAAGYVTIKGGPTDQFLEFASVPYAQRTELHETVTQGGRTTMRQIQRVPIPAEGTVEFRPGGKHLMIFGLSPTAIREGRTPMVLRFSDGSEVSYNAFVRTMGQPAE